MADDDRVEQEITVTLVRYRDQRARDLETYHVIWLAEHPNRYLLIPKAALVDQSETLQRSIS